MTAFESMRKKLLPLNVYDLSDDSNISRELQSLAFALDIFREHLDEVLRECFISSSESFGLQLREEEFASDGQGRTAASRRSMLILRKCLGENDFTPYAFENFLNSLGVTDYSFVETPSSYTFSVNINDSFSRSEQISISAQIRMFLPAHLSVNINFGGSAFSQIDAQDLTFAQFDVLDKDWSELDRGIS